MKAGPPGKYIFDPKRRPGCLRRNRELLFLERQVLTRCQSKTDRCHDFPLHEFAPLYGIAFDTRGGRWTRPAYLNGRRSREFLHGFERFAMSTKHSQAEHPLGVLVEDVLLVCV